MKIGKWAAVGLIGVLLPIAAVRAEDFRKTAAHSIREHTKEEESPFRKALKLKLKERNQSVPKKKIPGFVDYKPTKLEEIEDGIGYGPGDCPEKKRCPTPGYVVKFTAVTTFLYGGPDEVHDGKGGGKPEWPRLEFKKKALNPATGEYEQVYDDQGNEVWEDFTEEYKKKIADRAAALDPPQIAWKDEEHPDGTYEFGQEPQEEDVTEEITFTFKKEDQAQGKAFFRSLAAAMAAGDVGAQNAILMGFTYQGPNVDYTVSSKKRACLFGACVTLWDIKAGFALDFGLGLRTPAFSQLYGPGQMVAGNTYQFSSVIDTAGANGDWDAPAFAAKGVSAYADRGAAGTADGNEFVMYFELFAGAKVEILESNVCPYCQYVEVNTDHSTSFGTPFGPGSRFPLPTFDIPIKTFDFAIVSLDVGLFVTPNVTSTNISAVTSTGVEIAHSAPGAPASFPVAACIQGEAPKPRFTTVSIDEYKYHFNSFQIVLGAWMDFSVAGYGAWSPRFPFLTLDLSSALGSLGIYLPDHKTCNFAFQCATVPASQGVSVTSELLDESPPTTSLALAGTQGKNGWWTTDVTGTLAAYDNPAGCGAGVKETSWSLDGAPRSGNPFTLTSERQLVVTYASSDKDGNPEGVHTQPVWIDKTPPTLTGAATTPPNVRGWYNHDVVVHFDAFDATSGVATKTADTILSLEATGQLVVGTAEDHAGWTSSFEVGGINIDKTAPSIQIQVPNATDAYQADQSYTFAWTIQDALSGELSRVSTLDGSATAPVLDPNRTPIVSGATLDFGYLSGGVHEVRVAATDNADNVGVQAVQFVVDVDIDGLIHATELMCTDGQLSRGACKSLMVKAQQAKRALDAGNENAARGVLLGYKQELVALRGKGVKEDAFVLLYADVQYVLRRYGLLGNI